MLCASTLVGGGLDLRLLFNRTLFLPLLGLFVDDVLLDSLPLHHCMFVFLNTKDKDDVVRYIKCT